MMRSIRRSSPISSPARRWRDSRITPIREEVGYDLKIQVRIEIESAGNRPPDDVVAKLNAKLAKVSKDLKLG
jgi:hypothetical protein